MDYQEMLRTKTIAAEEAVLKIQDGDYVHVYGSSAEPNTFLTNMKHLKGQRKDIKLIHFLSLFPFDFYSDESYRGVIETENMFCSRFCTDSQKSGMMTFIPNHLRNSGHDRFFYYGERGKRVGVYVASVTPMDPHGYFSTATVGMSNRELVRCADIVMLEINENLPRTFGDSYIHISEVDYVFHGDNTIRYMPAAEPDAIDLKIGGHISELVENGATIQLGIGSIPNAVATALSDKKDLGVHTEMLGDAIVGLYKKGVVTNACKTHHRHKMVTTFSLGSKETYDFLNDNISVLHLDVAETNSPYEIAKNAKMVSVNTALQVDLMGQCASEAIGTLQISGVGGQTDTVLGAKMSPGGKSIIALRATAEIKDENGKRQRISKITALHDAGTVISLARSDADYIVTEYGIAALRGASLRERAESLIRIAHPDFRDTLREKAAKAFLI
jgi:acyl-CoA hydrolase